MDRPQGHDAAHINVGLMTDEEIYRLYLAASGYPRRVYGFGVVNGYRTSLTNRVLTAIDAVIYFGLVVNGGTLACVAAFLLLMCVVSVPAGPLSLIELGYRHYLASIQAKPPPMESIQLHSPEVLSTIAQYLAEPLLARARTLLLRLDSECTVTERHLGKSFDVRDSLYAQGNDLLDSTLRDAYSSRIHEVEQTIEELKAKHALLLEEMKRVKQETATIEKQVAELSTLALAKRHLAAVETSTQASTPEDRSAVLERLASLGASVEMATENLGEISATLAARESAEREVRLLSGDPPPN